MSAAMPATSGWVAETVSRGIRWAIALLELPTRGARFAPPCGCERTKHDTRLPGGISDNGLAFHCWSCGLKGDALTLLAVGICGRVPATGSPEWAEVRATATGDRAVVARARVPKSTAERAVVGMQETGKVWLASGPVDADERVDAFLHLRGFDVEQIRDLDLARALPRDFACLDWMHRGGASWALAQQQYRLLLPLFDERSRPMGIHAVALKRSGHSDKATSPRGRSIRGLVLANPLARRILRGEASARSYVQQSPAAVGQFAGAGVVIAEGATDYLAASTAFGDVHDAPAVFGVLSGSWTKEIAERIPTCRVVIATDPDTAGDDYARAIARTLRGRCQLLRWTADDDVAAVGLHNGTVQEMT